MKHIFQTDNADTGGYTLGAPSQVRRTITMMWMLCVRMKLTLKPFNRALPKSARFRTTLLLSAVVLLFASGCSRVETQSIEATGYCWCGECNGYDWGSWKYLKLDFWNRYINYGKLKGEKYHAYTASGKRLHSRQPGLLSTDSLRHPWLIPIRIVLFPWMLLPQKGTIAADTDYYPFGTKMYVPGYGWGVVEDRGGAIKGPDRIDLYYPTHGRANLWGRRRVIVKVIRPD